MSSIYCPTCAAKHEYTVTKPRLCAKCKGSMEVAVAPAVVAFAPAQAAPEPRSRVFLNAKGEDVSSRYSRPVPVARVEVEREESEYLDRDQAHFEAQELAAAISKTDFSFNVEKNVVRFDDLPSVQSAIKQAGAPKKAAKRKR